jgi:hypothetical protein
MGHFSMFPLRFSNFLPTGLSRRGKHTLDYGHRKEKALTMVKIAKAAVGQLGTGS